MVKRGTENKMQSLLHLYDQKATNKFVTKREYTMICHPLFKK